MKAEHSLLRSRPFVWLNMAMTIDGKVSSYARTPTTFTSKVDKRHLLALRAEADALMVGAHTARTDQMSMGIPDAKLRRQRLRRGQSEYPLRVIVSGRFTASANWKVFRHAFSPILIFTSGLTPPSKLRPFEKLARVYRIGQGRQIDMRKVLRILRRDWGVKKLLCEGGPMLNWSLFSRDLVDEVNLTLCPKIFGGAAAPTMVDGKGFLPEHAREAKLVSCRRKGNELFLVYRILHD